MRCYIWSKANLAKQIWVKNVLHNIAKCSLYMKCLLLLQSYLRNWSHVTYFLQHAYSAASVNSYGQTMRRHVCSITMHVPIPDVYHAFNNSDYLK